MFRLTQFKTMRTSMKKLIATVCIFGSALSLAACASDGSTTGNRDTAAPYAQERTAGGEAVREDADRVFQRAQNK